MKHPLVLRKKQNIGGLEVENIFALDIGTRKIVGLVMQKKDDKYLVIDSEMLEHKTRAMIDGQIHDVEAVAKTINTIKTTLETRLNLSLNTGAVAAAGRSLKTATAHMSKKRQIIEEISAAEVLALEMEAVGQAQYQLAGQDTDERASGDYFCVGYSVISYYLNDQKITSLVGQVGENIAVEVIATFLPQVVVDSLFSSLKRADLDIHSLTLEPIAALSIAIPPNMRLLNLSLIDIGAGTADIAIVKNGNIFAYAMVPMGGDVITEYMAGQYLLDFNTAENLKKQLGQKEIVEFTDILGNQTSQKSAEIIAEINTITTELVQNIAENILNLNQKTPDAVILIGGGSLTPNLSRLLAEHINIAPNRVGFRSIENMPELIVESEFLKGAKGMTPLGIAYNSFISSKIPFIKVKVNHKEIVLWNQGEITVANALLNAGISLNNIYGKPGLGKTIKINGIIKSFKGEIGVLPTIKINGETRALTDLVADGDLIEYSKGEDGSDRTVLLSDIIPDTSSKTVYINEEKNKLTPLVYINGEIATADVPIPDRAVVEYSPANTVQDILIQKGLLPAHLEEKHYQYHLNDTLMIYKWSPLQIIVNDQEVSLAYEIQDGDIINYTYYGPHPKIKDALHNEIVQEISVEVNGDTVKLPVKNNEIINNGKIIDINEPLYDGIKLIIKEKKSTAILSDVFKIIDLKPTLGRLRMIVDGEEAGFTTPIQAASKIELEWE